MQWTELLGIDSHASCISGLLHIYYSTCLTGWEVSKGTLSIPTLQLHDHRNVFIFGPIRPPLWKWASCISPASLFHASSLWWVWAFLGRRHVFPQVAHNWVDGIYHTATNCIENMCIIMLTKIYFTLNFRCRLYIFYWNIVDEVC